MFPKLKVFKPHHLLETDDLDLATEVLIDVDSNFKSKFEVTTVLTTAEKITFQIYFCYKLKMRNKIKQYLSLLMF